MHSHQQEKKEKKEKGVGRNQRGNVWVSFPSGSLGSTAAVSICRWREKGKERRPWSLPVGGHRTAEDNWKTAGGGEEHHGWMGDSLLWHIFHMRHIQMHTDLHSDASWYLLYIYEVVGGLVLIMQDWNWSVWVCHSVASALQHSNWYILQINGWQKEDGERRGGEERKEVQGSYEPKEILILFMFLRTASTNLQQK